MKPLSLILSILFVGASTVTFAADATITVQAGGPGREISPDLVGIFFEDLSYAADGGLYAELVENCSFEYNKDDRPEWNSLTSWELVQPEGSEGTLTSASEGGLNANNPAYAVLDVKKPGLGLRNDGFDGIPVKAGEAYDFSMFSRQLDGIGGPLEVRLEDPDGRVLVIVNLPAPGKEWKQETAVLEPTKDANDARLVVTARGTGRVAFDMISLFPEETFKEHENGLRADLAQTIADLKPRFVRFPGGCLVHGDGLYNIYNWKDTIGPVEQRKGQRNIWNYHQSVGLGYFEYFQFCEDIGAIPLPVVAAGVCCQNANARFTKKYGIGQEGIPMPEMDAYIQDVLDLIEWANGPSDSEWGSKRAAAGHPEPFGLKYLGIGNEDKITPVFKERFEMIFDAVRRKHPEIVVIGTVGPAPDGEDYEKGWEIANELKIPMVDEHYYKPPQWFWENLDRYDSYDRDASKVYVGEYAAHDEGRKSTLRSALAEAAMLTGFERNGDVVHFASYAPLIARQGHVSWSPDLVYFNGTEVFPTINYYVQQLFSLNSGSRYLDTKVDDTAAPSKLAASSVVDTETGDLIVKVVNGNEAAKSLRIRLDGVNDRSYKATKTVMANADPNVDRADAAMPQSEEISVTTDYNYEAPANSLTIFRISPKP